jgi:hypothetical protein
MMVLEEKAFFGGALLEIELHDDLRYRLCCPGLVEYADGQRRIRGGRPSAYQFRSVEQLRYDFERDLRAAGGSLGEAP